MMITSAVSRGPDTAGAPVSTSGLACALLLVSEPLVVSLMVLMVMCLPA